MYLYAEKHTLYLSWDEEGKVNEKFDKLVEFANLCEVIDKEQGFNSTLLISILMGVSHIYAMDLNHTTKELYIGGNTNKIY